MPETPETAPEPMRPEDVPYDLSLTATKVIGAHPATHRLLPCADIARRVLAAVLPAAYAAERAKVAEELEALAGGVVGKDKPYNKAFLHGVACAIRLARGEQP